MLKAMFACKYIIFLANSDILIYRRIDCVLSRGEGAGEMEITLSESYVVRLLMRHICMVPRALD